MPRVRPVFHPELAKFFEGLREAHGWKMRQAAQIAENRGLPLTRQILFRLEKGQIKNPEPEVLEAVAALYKIPYAELVGRFLTKRYKIAITARDLPDHETGVKSESSNSQPAPTIEGGHRHDVATTRALKNITRAYSAFFRAVQDVSHDLARLVSDTEGTEELRKSHRAGSGRRRRR